MPAGMHATHSPPRPSLPLSSREFLTGFHKRKLAKAEAARAKAKQREKDERQESRREVRVVFFSHRLISSAPSNVAICAKKPSRMLPT